MDTQEEIKQLKKRIAELEEQEKEEQELTQYDYKYWYVDFGGGVFSTFYDNNHYIDRYHQEIGNSFKTKKQAEFAVEKLKVEAELREFSRPFKEGENENWFILWGTYKKEIQIDWSRKIVRQGTIYFESREKANEAIEFIGEERIKKYLFEMEE